MQGRQTEEPRFDLSNWYRVKPAVEYEWQWLISSKDPLCFDTSFYSTYEKDIIEYCEGRGYILHERIEGSKREVEL